MNRLIVIGLVAAIGVLAWRQRARHVEAEHAAPSAPAPAETRVERDEHETFRCDGRVYCREMRSCAEAEFFLRNCANVKMDGDDDGIPCEDRCGHGR